MDKRGAKLDWLLHVWHFNTQNWMIQANEREMVGCSSKWMVKTKGKWKHIMKTETHMQDGITKHFWSTNIYYKHLQGHIHKVIHKVTCVQVHRGHSPELTDSPNALSQRIVARALHSWLPWETTTTGSDMVWCQNDMEYEMEELRLRIFFMTSK